MAKYRKKTIVIEAIPVKEAIHNAAEDWGALPKWFQGHYEAGGVVFTGEGIYLPSPGGSVFARVDDWIIYDGEVHTCKPDIFAATYEEEVAHD